MCAKDGVLSNRFLLNIEPQNTEISQEIKHKPNGVKPVILHQLA